MKNIFKNKIILALTIITTLVLAGIAVYTAIRLSQTRKESISPARPSSKPQAQTTVAECDFDIMLVIDRSGSMNYQYQGKKKLVWAKEAANALVNKLRNLPTGSSVRVGVVPLWDNDNNPDILALTSDLNSAISYINQIEIKEIGTCISCALADANAELKKNKVSGRKQYVVLLSDGCGNREETCTFPSPSDSRCCTSITKTRANSLQEANAGRSEGITYYAVGYEATGGGLDCNSCKYDQTTLSQIVGIESNLVYRPEPQTWAQAFVDIIDDICPPILTPTPTASGEGCPLLSFSLETPTPTPTATVTTTPTPTTTSTSSPSATPTSTATSTPGTTLVSCNGSCDDSSDCKSGLTCSDGVCRNPNCLDETDCTCPVAQATTEPSMPNAGVSLPTILGISTSIFLLIISLALAF